MASLAEQYRSDLDQLSQLDGQARAAKRDFRAASIEQQKATATMAERAVAMYRGSQSFNTWAVLSNAVSIHDVVDRVDAAKRLSRRDASIVDDVKLATRKLVARRKALVDLEERQRLLVKDARQRKVKAAALVAQREQALNSVNSEIRGIIEQRRIAAAAAETKNHANLQAAANAVSASIPAPVSVGASPDLGSALAPPVTSAPSGPAGSAAASVAMRYLGVPYVWGGADPSGFDCSGLVMYAYAQVGVSIPRTTYSQWNAGRHVAKSVITGR